MDTEPELVRLLGEQIAYYRALALGLPEPGPAGERVRFIQADLEPQGRVFFADDAYRTAAELVEGPSSTTIRRQVPGRNRLPPREGSPPASGPRTVAPPIRLGHQGHYHRRPLLLGSGRPKR